ELFEDEDGNVENPVDEGMRMKVSEDPDTKYVQLPAADLSSYEGGVRVLLGQIMAVSGLPAHYLGTLTDAPTSADSMRAAEASLSARAAARQAQFGRSWEDVAKLVVAVRDGVDPLGVDVRVQWAETRTRSVGQEGEAAVWGVVAVLGVAVRGGVDPLGVDVRVQWADTSARSVAQEADAAVKLFTAGLLPASETLARIGYSDDQVNSIMDDRIKEQSPVPN